MGEIERDLWGQASGSTVALCLTSRAIGVSKGVSFSLSFPQGPAWNEFSHFPGFYSTNIKKEIPWAVTQVLLQYWGVIAGSGSSTMAYLKGSSDDFLGPKRNPAASTSRISIPGSASQLLLGLRMFGTLVPKILTQYRRGGPRNLNSKLLVT